MVRVLRRVIPVLLVLVALPLFGQAKRTSPPKQLHLVGDHWTPYNPPDPATFPAGSKVHIIAKGDTLWALAQTYYGNAYLWPQLWEANTYITDSHWIYPGDPLLVQGETTTGDIATTTTTTGTGMTTAGDQGSGMTTGLESLGPPIAVGTEADIFCWGYLGHPDEPMPNRIESFEDADVKFIPHALEQLSSVTVGDVIYIDGGTSTGLIAGETYIVVKREELIEHPKTGEVLGRHYDYRGRVRILCADETDATAMVVQACKGIHRGDRLKPIPQHPIPLARMTPMANVCTPSSGRSSGFIVNAKDFDQNLHTGAVVEINLGRDDFVEPGDFLTIYRENMVPGVPRQVLGELGVLTAEAKTATARIVKMRYEMRVGDRIELK